MKNRLDNDYILWVLLNQATNATFKARERELRRCNITMNHAKIFSVIIGRGRATPRDIAKFLVREAHTVSNLITRMENDGLVRRVKLSGRNNHHYIEATEKGKRMYSKALDMESIHEIMSSLSEEEQEQLGVMLRKIRDSALVRLNKITELDGVLSME